MRKIPTLLCDFYKLSHRVQYPEGTEVVYSTSGFLVNCGERHED
jgi:hypothetical protein